MKTIILSFFALLLSSTPALAQSMDSVVETGRKKYLQYCSSCHGLSGRGDGPAAGAMKVRPSDLTMIAKQNGGTFPAGEVAEKIDGRLDVMAHGTRDMPVWGEQFGKQVGGGTIGEEVVRGHLHVIVKYLKSIQR